MPQFPIPNNTRTGESVTLLPKDSRHLQKVLRMRVGDHIELFNEADRFSGEIVSIRSKRTTVLLKSLLPSHKLNGEVTLYQALLKREKMEFLIQKGVELGATRFVPFSSERTVPWPKPEKIERWQRIADEALKQCGRRSPMKVSTPTSLSKILSEEGTRIVFHPDGEAISPIKRTGSIGLILGPEGGFSEREITLCRACGLTVASLGPLTLRAETASIAALALIQHGLGNL